MTGRAGPRPGVFPFPPIGREQIDTALRRDGLLRRARRGDVLAVAELTGTDSADLYAEALVHAAFEGALL